MFLDLIHKIPKHRSIAFYHCWPYAYCPLSAVRLSSFVRYGNSRFVVCLGEVSGNSHNSDMDRLYAISQITQEANDLMDQVPCFQTRLKLSSRHCLSRMSRTSSRQVATLEQRLKNNIIALVGSVTVALTCADMLICHHALPVDVNAPDYVDVSARIEQGKRGDAPDSMDKGIVYNLD